MPKAGYHALQRAYAPVLASFVVDAGGGLGRAVGDVSSGLEPVATTAVVTLAGFDGDRAPAGRGPRRARGRGVPGRVVLVGGARGPEPDRFLWVESTDGAFGANRAFLAEPRDLPLGDGGLTHAVERRGPGTLAVTITSRGFSYLVRVTAPEHPAARFSDNYLDLRDGDTATVLVTGLPEDVDEGAVTVGRWVGGRP